MTGTTAREVENRVIEAALVLADGSVFHGEHLGAPRPSGPTSGEVVFNTVLSGYQEVITDPSYAGQIITFTYPHIGSYGTTPEDDEAHRPFCRGVVVRDLVRRRSNWRATEDLSGYLRRVGLSGIAGIDTRRLTRHIRDHGAMGGAFGPLTGETDLATLEVAARAEPGTAGIDLVAVVTCDEPYTVPAASGAERRIVAYDFGIKTTILRHLATLGTVEVVPASTSAAEVLARQPDGVFLSNGPGDPTEVPYARDAIGELIGQVPIFGICLGHQLLCSAIGAETYKLPFGHHGGNHPVRDERTGVIEITSQNHNYAVSAESLGSARLPAEVTHLNLNDGVVEGIRLVGVPAFSVQHHPEAGPGPHDSAYLFDEFADLMDTHRRSPHRST